MNHSKRPSAAKRYRRRWLRAETLESRLLLTAGWRNPVDALDVNRDEIITPLDALVVINEIARRDRAEVVELAPRPEFSTLPYHDVNGDGRIEPIDALRVLNGVLPLTEGQYLLRESAAAASELSVTIGLGGDSGSRSYQFDVEADFDFGTGNTAVRDALAVYLVDPESPGDTLLDRGEPGTALFVLSGERADYPPGLVRFDGRTVSIDLTDLNDQDTGRLVFQLISQNDRSGSSVTVRPHSNEIDPEGAASPALFSRDRPVAPGDELEFAGLTAATAGQFEVDLRNVRFSRATGGYSADLVLINRGEPAGRDVAVVFPGLPAGVTLDNASGSTPAGNPYLSLRSAIPAGGLGTGQRTDPVRVAITTPDLRRFTLAPEVFVGQSNRAPIFPPLDPISVRPGEHIDITLGASDPDGDRVTYSLRGTGGPTLRLGANGVLSVMPTPQQIGSYTVTLFATDGSLTTGQDLQIDVGADPVGTTRVSGRVLDVDGTPLHGLQVEVAGVQGLTLSDGRFTLDLGSGPLAGDTLRVRGETFPGEASYPFIAEKLPFMLGREIFQGFENVIARPIYLPKLNAGQPVNPAVNTSIEATLREGHAPVRVDIAAGSLLTQAGVPFTGNLSITEVPVDLTPAALPPNLFPDQVITIQPGEMVFATPAPVSFPNTAGWEPGTVMDLWSINPVTGEFEIVGEMVVSADGTTIDTTSGGIRNSSWHTPVRPPDEQPDPNEEKENKDDNCKSNEECADSTSSVVLHSGAIREHHRLVSYQSLGEARSLTLHYHSQRADPRPIIHFGINNPTSGPDRRIVAKLTFFDGNQSYAVPGALPAAGQRGGEHFWRIPAGADGLRMAIQGDLRNLPTGIYDYQIDRGNVRLSNGRFTGTLSSSVGEIVHINSIDSPFGAGWDLAGIQRLHEHRDGSLLLVNGNGGTLRFTPTETSDTFSPPAGDFSSVIRSANGTYTRTMPDRTVHQFDIEGRLRSITDRNGNQTQHVYSGDRLVRIIDPVGLETGFAYSGDRVSTITDPAGRVTRLEHDASGDLVRIIDPDGSARTFDYDARHLPISETDQNGNSEQTNFGFHGRATGSVRKDGTTLTVSPLQTQALFPPELTRSPQSAPLAVPRDSDAVNVRPSGAVTVTVLDQAGQRISSRDPVGNLGQVSRNADNLASVISDARGFDTRLSYDSFGNITQIGDSITDLNSQSDSLYLGRKFTTGNSPWSIAIGDMDGDGIPDLITANAASDDVSVLLGNGEGTFAAPQQFAVGIDPRSIATGDLNGDGFPDLLTANSASDDVSILLGDGDGNFAPQQPIVVGDSPNSVAIGDVNRDGIPDLVTANSGSNDASVLLGNGDGTFAEQRRFATGTRTHSIAIGDVNGDGAPDMVTSNIGSNDVSVLLGDGDGNFAQPQRFAAGTSPVSIIIGDVNGDGIPDLITANRASDDVSVLLGNGDGNFSPQQRFFAGNGPISVAVGDVNGDEIPDLVAASDAFGSNDVSVLLGNGDGTFVQQQQFAAGSSPMAIAIGDMDGDGIPDLITPNRDSNDVSVLRGNGDGSFTFADHRRLAVDRNPAAVAIGDVNGDGFPDLVTANRAPNSVLVFLGNGDGTFADQQQYAVGSIPMSIAIGDVNDDGFPDLVTANSFSADVSVLLGNGNGTFGAQQRLNAGNSPLSIAIGDINGDGFADLVTANLFSNDVSTLLGNGTGTFATQQRFPAGNAPASIAIGDVNGDTIPDLVTANDDSGDVSILLGHGDGTFAPQQRLIVGDRPRWIVIGDVNRDGIPDLLTANLRSNDVSVLLGTGGGAFSDHQRYAAGDGPSSIVIGDVNADGNPDLITANSDSDDVSVLLGKGDGTFEPPQNFAAGRFPRWIGIGDVNGDGVPDLFTANQTSNDVTLLLGNATTSAQSALPRRITYDPTFNQLETVRDELGRLTSHEIDPTNGNRLATRRYLSPDEGVDVSGSIEWLTTYTYSPRGQLASTIDPLGRRTEYIYDDLGRLSSVTVAADTPVEATTRYEYNLAGNVTATIDANGNRSEFTFDLMNRLIEIREPDPDETGVTQSPATTVRYDQRGNAVEETDLLGQTTFKEYDSLDRLIRVTDSLGQPTRYSYDSNGNLASITDANGYTTRYQYDARDRRIREIDPDGGITSFRYDFDNNLILLTDPVGNTTRFAYDARGRLIREFDPTEQEVLYQYDAADNLIQKTDRNGRNTVYEYDELDRLTSEVWVNADSSIANTIEYAYDLTGNLLSVIDAYSTLEHTYDDQNRMLSADNAGTPEAPHVILNYTYDTLGNVVSVSETIDGELGATTEYTYDGRNRMISLQQSGPGAQPKLVDFVYNELGQFDELSRFSDLDRDSLVARTRWSYDELHRLISLEHGSETAARDLGFFDYDYDAAGRITAITDIDGRTDYNHDNRDQLISALRGPDDPRGNESYTFDASGNRLDSHRHGDAYVTGSANRLMSDSTFDYEYDAEGNMIRRHERSTGNSREFRWDHRNRLVRVVDSSADGTTLRESTYIYDAHDRRISKHLAFNEGGESTLHVQHYVYDIDHVSLEFSATPDEEGGSDPLLAFRNTFGPGHDAIIGQEHVTESDMRWLMSDHLGTVHASISSEDGALRRVAYDAFGNAVQPPGFELESRFGYTGRELDAETGLMFYRLRYYSAEIGRFLTEDPLSFGGGDTNLTRYVANQPTMARDPFGLEPWDPQPHLEKLQQAKYECEESCALQVAKQYLIDVPAGVFRDFSVEKLLGALARRLCTAYDVANASMAHSKCVESCVGSKMREPRRERPVPPQREKDDGNTICDRLAPNGSLRECMGNRNGPSAPNPSGAPTSRPSPGGSVVTF